jgi:ubiquinone biosynthesis monooxygenase Coq7
LAVLRATGRHAQAVRLIEEMKAGEARHLATFDRLLVDHKIRPTLFSPFWHIAGFALGAASALVSEKAAMACTEAVETAIDDHYAEQSRQLATIAPALTETIDAFRADEAHHRETAIAHGAAQAPLHGFLSKVIQAGCRAAIKLSERV